MYNNVSQANITRTTEQAHLQSGFVGGGVVGQPTTVSQALHHLEAEKTIYCYFF